MQFLHSDFFERYKTLRYTENSPTYMGRAKIKLKQFGVR